MPGLMTTMAPEHMLRVLASLGVVASIVGLMDPRLGWLAGLGASIMVLWLL